MSFDPRVLRFIERLYESDAASGVMPGRLDPLADLFAASSVVLGHYNLGVPAGAVAETANVPAGFIRDYGQYYCRIDPFAHAAKRRVWTAPSHVYSGESLLSFAEYEKTEFYADFGRRHQLDHVLFTGLVDGPSGACALSITRSRRTGPFTSGQEQRLRLLVPHLVRAVTLEQTIASLQSERDQAYGALDCCATAAVVIDRSGRVVFVNRAAQQIIDQNDGVSLTPLGLTALSAVEDRTLGDLIRRAAGRDDGAERSVDGCMKISRASNKGPFVVTVARMSGREVVRPNTSGSAVVVLIHDPEQRAAVSLESLERLYGLTPAEARVAADLMHGLTVSASAERRGVAESTVRWHLHHVLEKTGAGTQSQLMRLLSR
jgi:DNA-binding CsgD family transcriptional regulator